MNAIPIPKRMLALPRDIQRDLPIPWFVDIRDGKHDFRVIRHGGVAQSYMRQTCWICGQPLGRFRCFVLGPLSTITRVTSEPPCHRECAEYAVKVCPFMVKPHMRRQDHNLPADVQPPPGHHLDRNPGVMAIWVVEANRTGSAYRVIPEGDDYLIQLTTNPTEVTWFREGRRATRPEVYDSMVDGLPALLKEARAEGRAAVRDLKEATLVANKLLPELRPGDVMPALDEVPA